MRAIASILALFLAVSTFGEGVNRSAEIQRERTCFQTARPWSPELDLRSDVAIVYGVNSTFESRLKSWRDRGYRVHLMTGVAWGNYTDYLDGNFDGKKHWDEGQVQRDGEMIMHGRRVPYMVPSTAFAEYLAALVKRAVKAGVTAVHLEEPEFWARGGYSEGFKREWEAFYGEPWQPPHSSPEATWRASRLKYHLYFRTLEYIFRETKQFSESLGRQVPCYVPTHSLLNYSTWAIVSPESSLAKLEGMDGYIGQVWTGTARTPTLYNGIRKERTFENAFLEYGSLIGMTRPTGRRVYFLADPIEDNPRYTWEDYKRNYECTVVAQLLHPEVNYYEVMPWPGRIFTGRYGREGKADKERIPSWYATEILTVINALNDMKQTDVAWNAGTRGIGVVVSDTLMFQRFPTHEADFDRTMADWYGLALPFVKHGMPVDVVQLENLQHPSAMQDDAVLLLSYQAMKPPSPDVHEHLAAWVRAGGALLYCGRDDDAYQTIREWWNQQGRTYSRPSEHLFELLGLRRQPKEGIHQCGAGCFYLLRENPREIATQKAKAARLRETARDLYRRVRPNTPWRETNTLQLFRGPYRIVTVLDESVSPEPFHISGRFIDLFDPSLKVQREISLGPGSRGLYIDLDRTVSEPPRVLATANRIEWAKSNGSAYEFLAKGPRGTRAATRILLGGEPTEIRAIQPESGESVSFEHSWEPSSRTLLLRYDNRVEGVRVSLSPS